MKTSDNWEAEEQMVVYVECPYCCKVLEIYTHSLITEGDEMKCYECRKHFKLGKEGE